MTVHDLRARFLIAMGLPAALAACSKKAEPARVDAGASSAPAYWTVNAGPYAAICYPAANVVAPDKCDPKKGTCGDPEAAKKLGCPPTADFTGGRPECDEDDFCHSPLLPEPSAAEAKARGGSACCYRVPVPADHKGRALRDEGAIVVAETTRRDGWASEAHLTRPPHEARAAIARGWLDAARAEHAAIAAFARVALQLMELGAPADLVRAAHEAALDEVEHARLSFGVASAIDPGARGEAPFGPGRLPVARTAPADFEALVRETFDDGCVGETVGALVARASAERAEDPDVARALAKIADDEERHAELAWKILAWALREGGAPAARALRERTAAWACERNHGAPRDVDADGAATLEAWGIAGPATRRGMEDAAVRGIVEPCARALAAATARGPDPDPEHDRALQ
jgi:hypothetical protein